MRRNQLPFGPEFMGILTVVAVFLASAVFLKDVSPPPEAASPSPPARAEETPGADNLPPSGGSIRVVGVGEMTLEDYVAGVVAAEMPASFPAAALEAQGVAARTYALSRKAGGVHWPEGDVCTDPGCCQAYAAQAVRQERWGAEAELLWDKITAATAATRGLVLTYQGELIQAVFHAASYGQTAEAQEVWGQALPYLTSVSTPETAEETPNLESQVTLTAAEFRAAFCRSYPQAAFGGDPAAWVTLTRSPTGHVARAVVGGVTVTGQDLRTLFALRSTAFEVEAAEDHVTFRVWGYGHGVGMSQYGARAMAEQGATFGEILAHYYPGAQLDALEPA